MIGLRSEMNELDLELDMWISGWGLIVPRDFEMGRVAVLTSNSE